MMHQRVDQREIVGAHDLRMVICGEALRDRRGMRALVMARLVEADRTGAHRRLARLRHQRDDRRAVDATRQEGAERHIGDHAAAHALAHMRQQLLAERAGRSGRAIGEADVPPAARRRYALPAPHQQAMAGGQLAHAGDQTGVVGDVAECQIILDRGRIGHAAQ